MVESTAREGEGTSRRGLVQAGAAGLGAVALVGAIRPDPAVAAPSGCPTGSARSQQTPAATFGRMFDGLPPFAANTPQTSRPQAPGF